MRSGIFLLVCVIFFASCRGQKQKNQSSFEVNRFAKDSFLFATKLVDTTDADDALLTDGMTAIIVPERMGSEEEDFSNVKKAGFEMPCQCAFKDDTLTVVSALAWEGGFAYIARASQRQSSNSLMLFGKNRKWELGGRQYKEEIEVASLTNKLVISKPFPLKEKEIIYGWFDIKTPDFFEIRGTNEEKESEQHIMRIYFSCQVWPKIL